MIPIRETPIPEKTENKWQKIVNIMAEVLKVPSAIITRIKPPEIEVVSSAEKKENPYKEGDTVELANHYCEAVVKTKKHLEIHNAKKLERWKDAPEIEYGIISYLGYPIKWPGGEIFGTICILDSKSNEYGKIYHLLVQEFKELVETHLKMVNMIKELKEKNDQLKKTLKEVSVLRDLIPICLKCHKVKTKEGYWEKLERYFSKHGDIKFSHGYCEECSKEILRDI